jgi:hypothetical protein
VGYQPYGHSRYCLCKLDPAVQQKVDGLIALNSDYQLWTHRRRSSTGGEVRFHASRVMGRRNQEAGLWLYPQQVHYSMMVDDDDHVPQVARQPMMIVQTMLPRPGGWGRADVAGETNRTYATICICLGQRAAALSGHR